MLSSTAIDRERTKQMKIKQFLVNIKVKWKMFFLHDGAHTNYDRRQDRKICKCDLTEYVPSLYRESKGATGSQQTHYRILDEIFKELSFAESDSFIDVGCGKGRILAYMLSQKFKGKLTGIELNEDVASIAQKWSRPYDNVTVIAGDAFALDLTQYNVFFLGRPFEKKTFVAFLKKFENEIREKVTFIYWWDQQSGHFLQNRPGWTVRRSGAVHKLKVWKWLPFSFKTAETPQQYTIWEFDPEARRASDAPVFEDLADCDDYSLLKESLDVYCTRYNITFDRTASGDIYLRPNRSKPSKKAGG